MRKRRARRRTAAPQPALDRQPLAIEQRPDRARRRPGRPRGAPLQPGPHLHRPPGRMRPPHRKAALGDLLRHRLRMMQRRPRAIEQTLNAILLDTAQATCSRSSGSPRTAGTPPQTPRLVLLNRHHKAHPLIHGTGLHPSHRQGPPRRPVDLLPMSPVYSVTHVAGLDRAPSPRVRGEGRDEGALPRV